MTIRSLLELTSLVLISSRHPGSQGPLRGVHFSLPPLSAAVRYASVNARYWRLALTEFARTRRRLLPLRYEEKERYIAIRRRGEFDPAWYLMHYDDVDTAGYDPLHHLVRHGLVEGRFRNRENMLAVMHAARKDVEEPSQRPDKALVTSDPHAIERRPLINAPIERGCLDRFSDSTVQLGLDRFARFPLFKAADYIFLNQDVKDYPGIVSHRHAFTYGFSEGRSMFDRLTVANELGRRTNESRFLRAADATRPTAPPLSISVLCNGVGNSFLSDIASCLVHDLRADGHDVIMLDDRAPRSALRANNVVIAPHEFFFIGNGSAWADDAVVSRSVMLNTEQPQTIWFDRAVPFNLMSRGVVDISPQVASIYADAMPAMHCDLSGAAQTDVLPDASDPFLRTLPCTARQTGSSLTRFAGRPIDVSFFGGLSRHRERFFARTAPFFSDYKTVIYCRRGGGPLIRSPRSDMLGAARHVAFHSKVVLNIHREEFGFFEWHRIVRLGMEAGAVVVSEPCLPHPDFKPGTHYFEESGRHIQNLVEWLVKSPEGLAEAERVRCNALGLLEGRRAANLNARMVTAFLREVAPS